VIVHHRGCFRIGSSSCKSVHNRSNISYTQVNTRTHTQPAGIRGARRLAPLATPHTITLYASKRIETYGITFFWDLMTPDMPMYFLLQVLQVKYAARSLPAIYIIYFVCGD
jgi:hypothetical protein